MKGGGGGPRRQHPFTSQWLLHLQECFVKCFGANVFCLLVVFWKAQGRLETTTA